MKRLRILSTKIYDNVLINEPTYSKKFEMLIAKPFLEEKQILKIGEFDYQMLSKEEFIKEAQLNFNESFSDMCYSLILEKHCQISIDCLNFFIEPQSSGISNLK